MLSSPNTNSPANVDASVAYRMWKKGISTLYKDNTDRIVRLSAEQASLDGVKVPMCRDDYCTNRRPQNDVEEQPLSAESDDDYDLSELDDDDDDDTVLLSEKTEPTNV